MAERVILIFNRLAELIYNGNEKYGKSQRLRKKYCEVYVVDSVRNPGGGCSGPMSTDKPSDAWLKQMVDYLVKKNIGVPQQPRRVIVKGKETRILLSVWEERLREIAATVLSEAIDSGQESQGVACVIRNRAEHRKVSILSATFWQSWKGGGVGGDTMYGRQEPSTYGKWSNIYILSWTGNAKKKLQSTIKGLTVGEDITRGAYFWEGNKHLKKPTNARKKELDKKILIITKLIGQSTFMKYNPNKTENPGRSGLKWP